MKGGFENIIIEFKTDSMFEYRFTSCTGGEFGKGIYSLNNSILTLNFTEKKIDTNDYSPKILQTSTLSDTTCLSISMFNVNNGDFVKDFTLRMGINGKKVIDDSILIYKIHNRELPKEIEISSLGFARSKLKIETPGNYRIIINSKLVLNKEIKNGTKIIYRVLKATGAKLILGHPESKRNRIILSSYN